MKSFAFAAAATLASGVSLADDDFGIGLDLAQLAECELAQLEEGDLAQLEECELAQLAEGDLAQLEEGELAQLGKARMAGKDELAAFK